MNKLFKWVQGRTTGFCIAFFFTGTVLQVFHRLDAAYVSFMAVLLSAVIGHSIKEDTLTPPPPKADADVTQQSS